MLTSSSFYNTIACEYEYYCESSCVNNFLKDDIALLESYKLQSVLEFGIGDGRFAREYIKRNPNVSYTGVDNSEDMLMRAKDSGASLVLKDFTEYVEWAVNNNMQFDCIIAPYTAIHHIKTCEQLPLFENMKQMTKIIIINCVTKNEETKIFGNEDETEITFMLPNGNGVKTGVYKLHEAIRRSMCRKSEGGNRENIVWIK